MMIESVQERQRGGYDFSGYYDSLCALQNSCPITSVKAHVTEGVLDVNGDRIRAKDWYPIFNSIRINRTLHFISIRSYFQLNLDEASPDKRAHILRAHIPSIRDKDLSFELAKSLSQCLSVTESLTSLELQGLPLRVRDCRVLAKGISRNSTLKHLSLEYSRIEDDGAEVILEGIRQSGSVNTLNLSGCGLTSRTAETLSALIKYQGMCRHNSIWQESLRYRRPNLDTMAGLRRITLNENPLVEDRGAIVLAEALKDDLWVKALDLQQCGLTSVACRAFLGGVLKFNCTLVVLDLRSNPLIDRDLLRAVTEQVLDNGDGKQCEYKWLKLSSTRSKQQQLAMDIQTATPYKKYTGPSKPLLQTKRPVFKPPGPLQYSRRSRSADSSHARGRSRSVDHPLPPDELPPHSNGHKPLRSAREVEIENKRGLPWRTAARASRYKGAPPENTAGVTHFEDSPNIRRGHQTATSEEESAGEDEMPHDDKRISHQQQKPENATTKLHSGDTAALKRQDKEREEFVVNALLEEFTTGKSVPDDVKSLKVEVVQLRRQLEQEQELRGNEEKTSSKLRKENMRLQRQLDALRGRQTRLEGDMALDHSRGDMQGVTRLDEDLLATIEQSFKQFHAFLDLLRNSGLARVVSAAGMDDFTPTLPKPHPKKRSKGASRTTASATRKSELPEGTGKKRSGTKSTVKENPGEPLETSSPLEQSKNRAQRAKTEADRLYAELKAATERTTGPSPARDETYNLYGHNNNSTALGAPTTTTLSQPKESELPAMSSTWKPSAANPVPARRSSSQGSSSGNFHQIVRSLDPVDPSDTANGGLLLHSSNSATDSEDERKMKKAEEMYAAESISYTESISEEIEDVSPQVAPRGTAGRPPHSDFTLTASVDSTSETNHSTTKRSGDYPFAPVFTSQKSMDAVMELETDSD